MGWENTAQKDGAGDPQGAGPTGLTVAFAELTTAAAVAAAQLPAVCLLWWVDATSGDDYGSSYGGAFGLLCLFVFAPVLLPLLGFFHAVLHIAPAGALARLATGRPVVGRPVVGGPAAGGPAAGLPAAGRLAVGRLRGPEWVWHLLCAALLGVAWAALTALLWDWPFLATAALLAALGVLPVLGLAHVHRRARITGKVWGTWTIWLLSALASAGLFVLALAGAVLATIGEVIQDYEPPKLSAGQLAGDWRDDDGAVLRLRPDGRAELTQVPSEPLAADGSARRTGPDDPSFTRCDGAGSWGLRTGDPYHQIDRDGVLVRLRDGCGDETYWTIGGTADAPELFVLFGDPDAGDLRILTRDS